MHQFLLAAHNTLRWAVVIFVAINLYQSFSGWFGDRRWEAMDKQNSRLFVIFMDLQILVGFLLYFVYTPWGGYLGSMSRTTMRDPVQRFWVIEHFFSMVLAAILIHVAVFLSKKPASGGVTHKRNALLFLAASILILASIPWPFRAAVEIARPWYRINFL